LTSLLKKLGRAVTFQRNVQMLALTGTVAALASSSLIPISQPFMLSIIPEEDITALGTMLTIASLASNLVAVLGGFVADKYGRKPMMVLGTVLSCLGAMVYFQTRTTSGLLAAVLLSSIGGAMTLSLSVTMVSESAGEERRASSFGYVQMLGSMGSALGPIIGGWAYISRSCSHSECTY